MVIYELKIYVEGGLIPSYSHSVFINTDNVKVATAYISYQLRDNYGNPYMEAENKLLGFDFISRYGAIKLNLIHIVEVDKWNSK